MNEHRWVNLFPCIHLVTKAAFLKHARSILEAFSEHPRTENQALDELFQRRGAPTPIRAAYTKVPLDLGRFPRRPLTPMPNWTWIESSAKVQFDVGRIPRGPLTPRLDWTRLESPEVCIHQGPISHGSDPPEVRLHQGPIGPGSNPPRPFCFVPRPWRPLGQSATITVQRYRRDGRIITSKVTRMPRAI